MRSRKSGKIPNLFSWWILCTLWSLPLYRFPRNLEECVNACAVNPFLAKFFNCFALMGRFSPKTDFSIGSFGELWRPITEKRYDAEKRWASKSTSLAWPLSNSINPIVQKRIRCAIAAGNPGHSHFANRRNGHARADLIRHSTCSLNSGVIRLPSITTHPRFNFEQTWMHLRFLPTVATGFGLRCSF